MHTIYCKADTRTEMDAALEGAGFVTAGEDGAPLGYMQAGGTIVDVIGSVMLAPAVYAEDGETVITPAVVDEACHWNVYAPTPEVEAALSVYMIDAPSTPMRKLAGF